LFCKDVFDKFHLTHRLMWAPHTPALPLPRLHSHRIERQERAIRSQNNRLHAQLKSVVIGVMEPPYRTSTLIDLIATTGEFASTASMAASGFHAAARESQKPL
jgi:hypothetical protein